MTSTLDAATPLPGPPLSRRRGDRVRTVLRGLGETFITVGLVLLLFVVYEVYWTDVVSAGKQEEATTALDDAWASGADPLLDDPPPDGPPLADPPSDAPVLDAPVLDVPVGQQRTSRHDVVDGQGFAKLHIPSFGSDFQFTVLEGTTEDTLSVGPGHYTGTAFPGEDGNFAVAGHRVGKGAPFNDLDALRSCDAIIAETATAWYVYRVLPMDTEVADWAVGRGTDPTCAGSTGERTPVVPLGGLYAGVVGRQIVLPSQSDVIAPVPGEPAAQPVEGESLALLTLTTCHPRFSARERMIIHGVLVQTWPKDGAAQGQLPPEMSEG